MKHLSVAHTFTKLTLAKNSVADTVDDDSRPGVAYVCSANSFTKTWDAVVSQFRGSILRSAYLKCNDVTGWCQWDIIWVGDWIEGCYVIKNVLRKMQEL